MADDAPLESPDARTDDQLSEASGAYFPRAYLTEFLAFAAGHPQLEFLTYRDFDWQDDWNYEKGYPAERQRWKESLQAGERDPSKVYLVLQYDVDSRPERTMGLLRDEAHRSVPANVMIFHRRVDRRRLKFDDDLRLTPYELDEGLLKECEARGSAIGYHVNAHERAHFDVERALEIFGEDVEALRRSYRIDFFSAHGGVPGPSGLNNNGLPFPERFRQELRWVHNGHSPFFHRQFSDGGHNALHLDPADRDLRDFVRTLRAGERYRILLHPQYYDPSPVPSPRYTGTAWYDALASREGSLWSDVELEEGAG